MFDRKVVRIVTPGTLIDEKFMDPYESNFVLAIHPLYEGKSLESVAQLTTGQERDITSSHIPESIGLAWLDLSTGDFFTQAIPCTILSSALTRIGAREIVLNSEEEALYHNVLPILQEEGGLVTFHPYHLQNLSVSTWAPMLETAVPIEDKASFTNEEIVAGGLLLTYVKDKLQSLGLRLRAPVRRQNNENLVIDKNSLRGLEVLETSKDGLRGGKGSLFHSVRRTVTKSGTRLLKEWIGMPWCSSLQRYSVSAGPVSLYRLLNNNSSFAFNVFGNYQCKT